MTTHVADPYAVLGVASEASDEDLDHAFRVLVRQLHPDTRPPRPFMSAAISPATSAESDDGADQRLQEILNAYAILRDPVRRAAYDRARPATVAKTIAKLPAPRPAAPGTPAIGTLTPNMQGLTPTRVGPALRIGPVRWEPPHAATDTGHQHGGSRPLRRSDHGTH